MNLWKSIPGYPTEEDVIYEISSYLHIENKDSFSFSTLNSLYGKNWENKGKHAELIESSDKIKKIDKKTGGKDWYEIRK